MKRLVTLLTIVSVAFLNGCGGGDGGSQPQSQSSQPLNFAGCYAIGATTSNVQCGTVPTFGDPQADAAFSAEVAVQTAFWQNLPTRVDPLNDCSSPNAVSLPTRNIQFGTNMFRNLITKYGNGLPVTGVLAHEWGHQAQFANGWMNPNSPTVRATELEADAFSGYYVAIAKGWAWSLLSSYFDAVFSLGDYAFNDRGHHGTPDERLAAARLGFDAGVHALQTNTPLSYQQLHQIFSTSIPALNGKGEIDVNASMSPSVKDFLRDISTSEAFAIARGETRGSERIPPVATNRQDLFPRSER